MPCQRISGPRNLLFPLSISAPKDRERLFHMRLMSFGVAALALMAVMSTAQAKGVSKQQVEVCRWGADMARSAQQSKLSGTTLWRARENLKVRKFSKPWMPKMALGITEQTYASRSRLQPASVKKTYYEGCIRHEQGRHQVSRR